MKILSFGEILWDIFPDKKVIGGAPFNFSAHAARLGAQVSFVTAVGCDELGESTLECIREKKVSDFYAGRSAYPTGACFVTVDDKGSPSYDLRYDMAYDHIRLGDSQWDALERSDFRALYFGTLAQRHPDSRQTLREILARGRFQEIFFDVNIRQNWYGREVLESGLDACTLLKVSREEAGVFADAALADAVPAAFSSKESYYGALCAELSRRYNIKKILLTLDKDGALVYDAAANSVMLSEKPRGKVVATVGAGDSFSACYLYHFLKGDAPEICLHKAIVLSDYVVGHIEAIPEYSKDLWAQLA